MNTNRRSASIEATRQFDQMMAGLRVNDAKSIESARTVLRRFADAADARWLELMLFPLATQAEMWSNVEE